MATKWHQADIMITWECEVRTGGPSDLLLSKLHIVRVVGPVQSEVSRVDDQIWLKRLDLAKSHLEVELKKRVCTAEMRVRDLNNSWHDLFPLGVKARDALDANSLQRSAVTDV